MSVLDYAQARVDKASLLAVPPDVEKRLRRGREAGRQDSVKRRLCQLFLKGDTYFYINQSGALNFQEVNPGVRSGKPTHRVRNRYNFIRPIVDSKVSGSTTRVPGYEVNPTGTDPDVVAAAHLSEKILRMGYELWYLREARIKAAELAIGGGGVAYAIPYFDAQVGPFSTSVGLDGTESTVGEGEIKVLICNGNEVISEPGVDFYHSRWYCYRVARPKDEVAAMEGYIGGVLMADANVSDNPSDTPSKDMVMVEVFAERPCPKYPNGRTLTIAGGHQILKPSDYPLMQSGVAIDQPFIHRLMYRMSAEDGQDLGLTWELIDFQRTANDCYNKIVELKNRALNLRMLAPRGSLKRASTDEPGGIDYYDPVGGFKPEWEKAPDPSLMGQLMQILNRTLEDMRYVAADADITAAPNVAQGVIQAVNQQAASRWSQFIGDLARFDANVASHCLMLAQEHYSEKRILKVRGRYGWEPVSSFLGADIMGQTTVSVNPATLETHSRQAVLQQLGWIQANFPGYVRPEVAIDIAMTGTSAESVVESFEYDKARANFIIQSIRNGSVMSLPMRDQTIEGPPDPLTGQPVKQTVPVPGWMPRPFDNVDIQMWVFENWLKTDDAARLPVEMHAVAMLIWEGMKELQAQQAAQAQAAQQAQAMALGDKNAAVPGQPKPMPSTPNPAGDGQGAAA